VRLSGQHLQRPESGRPPVELLLAVVAVAEQVSIPPEPRPSRRPLPHRLRVDSGVGKPKPNGGNVHSPLGGGRPRGGGPTRQHPSGGCSDTRSRRPRTLLPQPVARRRLASVPVRSHARVVDSHLAAEQPSSRGTHGWAHAVPDTPDVHLTVCALPVGALVESPDCPSLMPRKTRPRTATPAPPA
jgi:hypothetical protein